MDTPTQAVRFFSAGGRLGRLRYLGAILLLHVALGGIAFAGSLVLTLVAAAAPDAGLVASLALAGLLLLVTLWFTLLWTVQRCHDFNASGWWSLLVLIPLAGLVFLFIPGNEGENRFGPPPPENGVGVILAVTLPLAGAFLIAIPLLGIIAAIAIPAYNGYVEASREAAREAAPLSQPVPERHFQKDAWRPGS